MSKVIDPKSVERPESLRLACLALALFAGGLLLPFAAYPALVYLAAVSHQPAIQASAGLGLVCEVLALAFGIAGRRHLPGKVAGVGSGLLLGLVLLMLALFIFR